MSACGSLTCLWLLTDVFSSSSSSFHHHQHNLPHYPSYNYLLPTITVFASFFFLFSFSFPPLNSILSCFSESDWGSVSFLDLICQSDDQFHEPCIKRLSMAAKHLYKNHVLRNCAFSCTTSINTVWR